MTDAEMKRYATLICDAIQDRAPRATLLREGLFARANAALARERARQPVKQPRGGPVVKGYLCNRCENN